MSRGARNAAATALCLLALLLMATPTAAQFSSGSSGVHGSFPPYPTGMTAIPNDVRYLVWNMGTGLVRYCTTYDVSKRPDTCLVEAATAQIPGIPAGGLTTGVFEFTSVDVIPAANIGELYVSVIGDAYNAPLSILSQGAIRFRTNVYFYANGIDGQSTASGLQPSVSLPGGKPGPGGFAGGSSGFAGTTATAGSPGFGPAGGLSGESTGASCYGSQPWYAGLNAGVSPTSTSLAQLIGGSGGGGASSTTTCGIGHNNGGSGGGGGGAVLMAANTEINFGGNNYLYLTGGTGGSSYCGCYEGGAGAGGTLKLVAPRLLGSSGVYAYLSGGYHPYSGGAAAGGTIRVEGDATQFNLGIYGQSSGTVAATPGPLSPITTPSLRIAQVGDLVVPTAPTGNTATPDVNFPSAPTGPVSVTLAAANIPLGATIKVRVTPQVGSFSEVTSSALSGTTANSTATASVTIPPGYGAITATASFGCDGTICALLPARDRAGAVVEVVASAGGSHAFIVTKEGRRIALSD